jgi:hypothetical protein
MQLLEEAAMQELIDIIKFGKWVLVIRNYTQMV